MWCTCGNQFANSGMIGTKKGINSITFMQEIKGKIMSAIDCVGFMTYI